MLAGQKAICRVVPAAAAGVAVMSTVAASAAAASQNATRAVTGPLRITLYQYDVCPFCCKTKAFLDYNKVPYTLVEVNPLSKREMAFSSYRKVPFAIINGQQFNGSNDIIDAVGQALEEEEEEELEAEAAAAAGSGSGWLSGSASAAAPAPISAEEAAAIDAEEAKWRHWVDEDLVHTLSPNIYRTPSEALQAFDYIADISNFSWVEAQAARYAGAIIMYLISKQVAKRHGYSDVRQALYERVTTWVRELGEEAFHGGYEPDKADLAVFGVLRAIQHTPSFVDLVKATEVSGWYRRMEEAVGPSSVEHRVGRGAAVSMSGGPDGAEAAPPSAIDRALQEAAKQQDA